MIIKEEFQTEISELKETCAKSELEKEKLLKKNQEYEAKLSKQNIELENYSSTRKKFICKKCCTDLESGYMLDCGHLPFCNSCSMSITIEESPKCPICKKSVAYRLPALIEELIWWLRYLNDYFLIIHSTTLLILSLDIYIKIQLFNFM